MSAVVPSASSSASLPSASSSSSTPDAASPAPGADPALPAKAGPPRRLIVIAGLCLLGGLAFGARLWWHSTRFADTDNAVVSGHVHPVAARVPGVVVEVLAQDNQTVHRGDPLLRLDPADQQMQLERLDAQLVQAGAAIAGGEAQVAQARAQLAAAQAQVVQAQATVTHAEQEARRAQRLFEGGLHAVSEQELEAATTALTVARADLGARRAAAQAMGQAVASAEATRSAAVAQKGVLEVQLKEARLQQGYNEVPAPSDGRVGKRTVEVGQRVQAGQQLAAVVEDEVWITANFKETQLAHMKPGQLATVHIDAFGDREFHARVHSFAPASGATFALLPPDNATGNFTKIVQRVPVKLLFAPQDLAGLAERVVPGMSVTVSVDLRS